MKRDSINLSVIVVLLFAISHSILAMFVFEKGIEKCFQELNKVGMLSIAVYIFLGIVAHKLLHYIALFLSGVKTKDLKKKLNPFHPYIFLKQ